MFAHVMLHDLVSKALIRRWMWWLSRFILWSAATFLSLLGMATLCERPSLAQELVPPPVRVIWKRAPIRVDLEVGKERMITFPESIRLGVSPAIAAQLRVQVVERTAYLVASAPFASTRIVAESPVQGSVYLLDITATVQSIATPAMEIHLERSAPTDERAESDDASHDVAEPEALDFVQLTRYAALQVYAPRRLLRARPGVHALMIDTAPIAGLYRLAAVRAQPLGSWKSAAGVVTAVRLTNESQQALELDPRALRGRWLAATFQHGRLLPRGSEDDTTVAYLISERSFEESR